LRTPTDRVALYEFWIQSLKILLEHHCESLKEAKRRGIDIPHIPEDPQCGFFRARLVRGGPWVVARIFLAQPVDRRGKLAGDEVLKCEIAGADYEPAERWLFLCDRPISEAEFRYGVGFRKWSEDQRIHVPKPDRAVDWLNAPSPTFPKAKRARRGTYKRR
jgi:hypothetical protein